MRDSHPVFLLFICLVFAPTSGCKRHSEEQRTVPESTVQSMESTQAQDERSRSLEPEAPTESTPLDLLNFVAAEATSIGWIDLDAFREQWVHGLVGDESARREAMARAGRQLDLLGNDPRVIRALGDSFRFSQAHELLGATGDAEDDWIVISNGSVSQLSGDARRINPESQVRVGRRDGFIIFGQGALFELAMAGIPVDDRFSPELKWAGGWEVVHESKALGFFSPSFAEVPEPRGFSIPDLGATRASRVVISGDLDGSLRLAVANDDEKPLRQLFGAAFAYSTQASSLANDDLPQFLRDWGDYTALITRSLWSRLTMETREDLLLLELREPECGRPIRNVVPALGILGAVYQVLNDDSIEGAPLFETVEAPVVEGGCPIIPGPAPNLPRAALRATADGQHFSALGLVDYGAIFRHNLPSAFQILPFAIEASAVEESFENNPLGLESASGDSAMLAAYVEKSFAQQPAELFFSMPPEASQLLPRRIASTLQSDEDLGHIAATPRMMGRYLTGETGGAAWESAVASLPANSAALVVAPKLVFEAFAEQLELPEQAKVLLRKVRTGTLVISQDLDMSFYFAVDEDPQQVAAELRGFIEEFAATKLQATAAAQRAHRGGLVFDSIAKLLSSELTVEALDEHTVRLSFGAYGKVATGILSAVSIYSAMVRLQVFESGWPTPSLQVTPGSIQRTP